MLTFSERIQRRWQVLWAPARPSSVRDTLARLHRAREILTPRSRNDPDEAWRCCELWQRRLSNKWNAREFAQKHGVRVPALYWVGRRLGALPLDFLPDHFVIRPSFGHSRQGVFVMAKGVDLLTDTPYTTASLRAHLRRTAGRWTVLPLLVEEFARTEEGDFRLPLEFRAHTFGETIGAIEVVERATRNRDTRFSFYDERWERIPDTMYRKQISDHDLDPPRCLVELLACARRLGTAYGTYARIDFFSTDVGCVFGEFASTPAHQTDYTAYAQEYFGALWQETFGDAV